MQQSIYKLCLVKHQTAVCEMCRIIIVLKKHSLFKVQKLVTGLIINQYFKHLTHDAI